MNQLLDKLTSEIKHGKETLEQEQQMLRLQEAAKVYKGDDRVVSSEELWEEIKNQPEKEKFYSNFSTLDKKMQGFTTGESIFLTGITKHGKTSFCMELSVRFEEQQPLWLSFEEKSIDLLRKFREKTDHLPHMFTPRQNEKPTLDWVESKIVEAKVKYNSKVVFIDHIGFLKDAEHNGDNEASTLERISRKIHSLAVKWDVCIFLLGHLTKVRSDQNPTIEDIKGSSAMAQEADLSILIWRRTQRVDGRMEIGHETNVSLQANRRGDVGNIEYKYDKGRFQEMAWDIQEEEVWDK
jgi:replicative DNA helicase